LLLQPMASRFKGVNKHCARWQATLCFSGKTLYLGTHDEEEDAARAHDAKARELGIAERFLNFGAGLPPREGPPSSRHDSRPIAAAGFRGVTRKSNGRYNAQLWAGSERSSSMHDTAEQAAHAWDEMARKAGRPEAGLNYPRGGQPSAVVLAAPCRERPSKKRRRVAVAPPKRASGRRAFEDEAQRAGAEEEAAADPAAWLAEAETASLPRLRELLQAAKRRAAAREARRGGVGAADAASAASVVAIDAADASEAAAPARELLPAAARAGTRLVRRRAAEKAVRDTEEAAAEAASLLALAEAMAAEEDRED